MFRKSILAGSWYAGTEDSLLEQIKNCFLHPIGPRKIPRVKDGKRKIVSIIVPHAGYVYSGPVAAYSYYALAEDGKPDTFVIIGPNHTGIGSGVSIMVRGTWETPLGTVDIDGEIAEKIESKNDMIREDLRGHESEHSIEIQLPFLQFLYGKNFKFVPITMMWQNLNASRIVGRAVAESIKGKNAVVIATTDFSHYVPHEEALELDKKAIDCILALNEEKLQRTVLEHGITMCGYGPVSAAVFASKELGAKKAQLLKYATSGDVTGDRSSVVGYGSLKVTV